MIRKPTELARCFVAAVTVLGIASGAWTASTDSRSPASVSAPTTLVYGTTEEPDTLNPETMQLTSAYDLDSGIFDTLVKSDNHGNVIPDLATSWSISKDGLTYTFHLRHGVRWADGTPFTARDVIFTYEQIISRRNNNFSTRGWDLITSAHAPDSYTTVFRTKKTYAPFFVTVGEQNAIIPEHYFRRSPSFLKSGDYNTDPFNRRPFGTGPYLVADWRSADHITLVSNKYYWGIKPYFRMIVAKILPDNNTLLTELRTNEVQIAKVAQQQASQAGSLPGKVLIERPGQGWYHIDLKQWGFLRDQHVRIALDYATPKQKIITEVLHGYGRIDDGDIAPISWAYTSRVPRHPFDPRKAAHILALDGFEKGSDGVLRKDNQPLSIQIWYYDGDEPGEQIDRILKREWARIGVAVDLRHQDVKTIFGSHGPMFTKRATGISYTWFNGNDPDDSFYWSSSQIPNSPTGSGGNDCAYFHTFAFQKEIDDLTAAGVATLNRVKRKSIYARIERLLAEQTPDIFIDWQPVLAVASDNLKGFDPNAFNYLFYNVQRWRY